MTSRKEKRHATVGKDKGMLRIQLSRPISRSLFNVRQKCLYLHLPDTPDNRRTADAIALAIENDIRANKLQKPLETYLPVAQLQATTGLFFNSEEIQLSLLELYDLFAAFMKPQLHNTTYVVNYQGYFRPLIAQAPQNLNHQHAIVSYAYQHFSADAFLKIIPLISRAFNWGKKRGYIPPAVLNQIVDFREDYTVFRASYQPGDLITTSVKNYTHDKDYRAFTRPEAEIIMQAFEAQAQRYQEGQLIKRRSSRAYPFPKRYVEIFSTIDKYVKFNFWTGCRNCEASGLRWLDVDTDNFSFIVFRNAFSSATKELKSLKTEHVGEEGTQSRRFPCGEKLSLLLEELYRSNYNGNPEAFVFVNSVGNPITNGLISEYWYGKRKHQTLANGVKEVTLKFGVVSELVIQGQLTQYLTPYATRHSWITSQIIAGVHINNVAKLAGNSPKTIYDHYSSFVPGLELAPEF